MASSTPPIFGPERPPPSPTTTYLNRSVHPKRKASHFDRLMCFLLNYLNSPELLPNCGTISDFFTRSTFRPVFQKQFSSDSPQVREVRLDVPSGSFPAGSLHHVIFKIITRTSNDAANSPLPMPVGDQTFSAVALAVCHDNSNAVCTIGGRYMMAFLSMPFIIPEDSGVNARDVEWDTLLRILRRTGKLNFDSGGEMREKSERLSLDVSLPSPAAGLKFREVANEWIQDVFEPLLQG